MKNTFYRGYNPDYIAKLNANKDINLMKLNSEVKEYTEIYLLGIEFIMKDVTIKKAEEIKLNCNELIDERGYVVKEEINKKFQEVLNKSLKKIN
jgi:hypothetical protein